MRFFEVVMVSLLIGSACCALACVRFAVSWIFVGLTLTALLLHLSLEGAHWQMVPVYLGVLLLVPTFRGRRGAVVSGGFVLLLAAASCVASTALPIFKLPAPSGPYTVGTRVLYLKDLTRSNAPAPQDGAGSGRDLVVQLWYPAAASGNRFAVYRPLAESTLQASYMSVVPTHSRLDAPLAADAAPWHVLLFNPAWENRRGQSTALLEELASHGYVVAAIEHPGRTGPILLQDGRVLPVVTDPEVDDLAHTTVERIENAVSAEVDKEAADDSFVLDQLAAQDSEASSPLYRRLDTQHAGVLGHSLGGAVAADAASLDPRLLSAFSMSAPFFGKVRTTGLRKPYFNISEELHLPAPEQIAQMEPASRVDAETDVLDTENYHRLLRECGGYQVVMAGINHSSFTDKAFYSPLRKLNGAGTTPRDRVLLILREYAVQFFDRTLKGKSAPLLDATGHPFPEVTQQYFAGQALREMSATPAALTSAGSPRPPR